MAEISTDNASLRNEAGDNPYKPPTADLGVETIPSGNRHIAYVMNAVGAAAGLAAIGVAFAGYTQQQENNSDPSGSYIIAGIAAVVSVVYLFAGRTAVKK